MKKKTLEDISKQIDPLDKRIFHFLRPLEVKMLEKLVPLVPKWLETYHLTLVTFPLAVMIILVGWLARGNKVWFLAHFVIVVAQYLSDALDGEVGRRRQTGLVRWGFYADHFSDFVFNQALVLSYSLAFPESSFWLTLVAICTGGMFVHEALSGILTGQYNIGIYGGLGAMEMWSAVVLLDFWLVENKPGQIKEIAMGIFVIVFLNAVRQFLKNGKVFWQEDMKAKNSQEKNEKENTGRHQ